MLRGRVEESESVQTTLSETFKELTKVSLKNTIKIDTCVFARSLRYKLHSRYLWGLRNLYPAPSYLLSLKVAIVLNLGFLFLLHMKPFPETYFSFRYVYVDGVLIVWIFVRSSILLSYQLVILLYRGCFPLAVPGSVPAATHASGGVPCFQHANMFLCMFCILVLLSPEVKFWFMSGREGGLGERKEDSFFFFPLLNTDFFSEYLSTPA